MLRLLAHRAVLALERPQHELLRAAGGEPLAAGGPAERAHARRIAGHAHVLGVDDAPAVQRRLLHGGDQELAVRAEGDVVVRALPLQHLGRGLRVRKPQRHAVVVGDGEPQPLGREGKPADGRGHVERARLALAGLHEGRLAGRPGDRAVRTERDVIDPAALGVGRDELGSRRSASVANTLPSSPPVTMRAPSLAAARMPPAWTATRRSSPLSGHQQQRLLAEHEDRGAAEEMRGHHRRAGRDRARALDDGGGVGWSGVGHESRSALILRSGRRPRLEAQSGSTRTADRIRDGRG